MVFAFLTKFIYELKHNVLRKKRNKLGHLKAYPQPNGATQKPKAEWKKN